MHFERFDQNRAAASGGESVRAASAISDLSRRDHHPTARAVSVGRLRWSDGQLRIVRKRETTDSPQCRGRDLSLGFELGRIVDVLPRTTTTGSEDGTNGIYALRAGLEERLDNAARVVGSTRRDSNANAVARRRKGNEDDPAIGRVTDTVPTRSEFLDFDLDALFGVRCRMRSSRLATVRMSFSTGYRLTPSTRPLRGSLLWSGIGGLSVPA